MASDFESLVKYIQDLRQSTEGCAWTKSQTVASLLPQTLEEIYEIIHAYEHQDDAAFNAELGDLLYHVAFYLVIEIEKSDVPIDEALRQRIEQIIEKHEKRLPPKQERVNLSAEEVNAYWQHQKGVSQQESIFDDLTLGLPAMMIAGKCQQKAANLGFDWKTSPEVMQKLEEEIGEIKQELHEKAARSRLQDELGDVLFTCVNLARHLQIDPEIALQQANQKFMHRFKKLEKMASDENLDFHQASIDELEELWQRAKKSEDKAHG